MRCEKYGEFTDDQCDQEAEIRAICTPATGNEVGVKSESSWCRDCADHCSESKSWTYLFHDLKTSVVWVPPPILYASIPVHCEDTPRWVLRYHIRAESFRKDAEEVIRQVMNSGGSIAKLIVGNSGVIAIPCER